MKTPTTASTPEGLELIDLTDVYRSAHGWCASTDFKLMVGDKEKMVRVFTMKRHSGSIVTTVQVGTRTHGGGFLYAPSDDYSGLGATETGSATSMKIKAQHESVLRMTMGVHVEAIQRFYARKAVSNA